MVDKKNDCAFPADAKTMTDSGMRIRTYVAAKAMQGLLTRLSAQGDQLADEIQGQPQQVAEWSVKMADALLDTLEEKVL